MEKTHDNMVQFIEDANWPYWPLLPMKRSGGENGMETGWVTADFPAILLRQPLDMKGVIVQIRFESSDEELGELGVFDPRKLVPETLKDVYESWIIRRYQDVHAMLDDGWVID